MPYDERVIPDTTHFRMWIQQFEKKKRRKKIGCCGEKKEDNSQGSCSSTWANTKKKLSNMVFYSHFFFFPHVKDIREQYQSKFNRKSKEKTVKRKPFFPLLLTCLYCVKTQVQQPKGLSRIIVFFFVFECAPVCLRVFTSTLSTISNRAQRSVRTLYIIQIKVSDKKRR